MVDCISIFPAPSIVAVYRCTVFVVLLLISAPGVTQDYEVGSIHIVSPWSRALPPTSEHGATYFTLINHGDSADQLLGASSPIAVRAEIHTHTMTDSMMKMRHLEFIDLPPGEEIRFRPGEHHIMLIHLKQQLKEGSRFPLILQFDRAGHTTVEVVVQPAGAENQGEMQHDHGDSVVHDQKTATTRIDLQIRNSEVDLDNKTIRVTQGSVVELHWSSDQTHALHLHGYDVKINVTPDSTTITHLEAKATGRFPVEIHGSNNHNTLIYIEVYPK